MKTNAQKAAQKRYNEQNVKLISISLFPKDKDIYTWLQTKKPRATFIRELLRKELEREIAQGQYIPPTE